VRCGVCFVECDDLLVDGLGQVDREIEVYVTHGAVAAGSLALLVVSARRLAFGRASMWGACYVP
jgi:hypothetical protein